LAVSIGARSQSAKTYLEKHFESFQNSDLDALIVHGMRSIRDTLQQDKTITTANCTVAFVGKDAKFTVLEGDGLKKYYLVYSGILTFWIPPKWIRPK
jgi:20S proteasome subunit alpha 6